MPSKDPAQRLRDILENIDSIRFFTYESVDDAIIWRTVEHDLVALREVAAAEVERRQ